MPSNIVISLADKTGKTVAEVESKWEEAKKIVKKKTSENDDKYWPTVVSVVKSMLHVNEEATVSSATTTSDIATVPKRLGDKPMKQASIDGELNGFPYFEIKEVGDYLKLASAKRMNKKLDISDQRIHDHVKTKGGPFLVKHGNNVLKLTKKDIYG